FPRTVQNHSTGHSYWWGRLWGDVCRRAEHVQRSDPVGNDSLPWSWLYLTAIFASHRRKLMATMKAVPFPKIEQVTIRDVRPEESGKLYEMIERLGWFLPLPNLSAAVVAEVDEEII